MAHNAPEGRTAAEKRGHELFDLDVSYIGWFSVGLIILLIVTAGTAFYMLGGFRVSDAVLTKQSTEGSLSGPFATLQETPQDDLRSYRRSKAAGLEGYHWVDRSGGVVQIPIERAMELVAAQAATRPAPDSMDQSPPPPQQPRGHKP
ncbi:MAG: hypothetical protein ABSH33_18725 [Steroidobacteraceae bacterium]|jgi:hypothetical protein